MLAGWLRDRSCMKDGLLSIGSACLLSFLIFGHAVLAQSPLCPVCRAPSTFGRCPETILNDPPQGALALTGKVIAVKRLECTAQLTVNVTHSGASSLPATIDVDLSWCMPSGYAIGDVITGLVSATPNKAGVYSARPDFECWKDGHPR